MHDATKRFSGLTTREHDAMDVMAYFKLVYKAVTLHKGNLIIDVFAGGGRDILTFTKLLNGNGRFVAIDRDQTRISDMMEKKNKDGFQYFMLAESKRDLSTAFKAGKIAAVQGEIPDAPYGKTGIDLSGQAGLVLCNAGIMDIPAERLQKTISVLAKMLAPGGEVFVRFSQIRSDRPIGRSYHLHDPVHVTKLMEAEGLTVTRNPDIDDPVRPFLWVDLHGLKSACPKPMLVA